MTERQLPLATYGILVPGEGEKVPYQHQPGYVAGYKRRLLNPHAYIYGAFPDPASTLKVAVLRLDLMPRPVYDDWLARFDRIEGVASDLYDRVEVDAVTAAGTLRSWLYVPTASTMAWSAKRYAAARGSGPKRLITHLEDNTR